MTHDIFFASNHSSLWVRIIISEYNIKYEYWFVVAIKPLIDDIVMKQAEGV